MIHPKIKKLYNSSEWIAFRMLIITERAKRDGGPTCEHCGKRVAHSRELTVHHKIELTPDNVEDAMISLNPDNVLVVHNHPCHDIIHKRFGFQNTYAHNVYLVYGPPLSGKNTFVRDNMQYGDIVVDMDKLYHAITLLPEYEKPDQLFPLIRGVHNLLIDNIKTRYGKWENAWVIGGYPNKYKREKVITDLGAEPVFCDVPKDECLWRLAQDNDRKDRRNEWAEYIERWFESYTA
jgi:hypothetical protein